MRVDLDHIEVVGCFVEADLELECFVVGLVVGAVGKTVGVRGIVEVGIVMTDPAGKVGLVAAEVGLVVGETVVMVWVLVQEGIAVGV